MATEKSTTLRLRRIRFKDGRTIEVFRPKSAVASETDFVNKQVQESFDFLLRDEPRNISAYAIVVWNEDETVYVRYEIGDKSAIVAGGLPSLVRDILTAEMAIKWSNQ